MQQRFVAIDADFARRDLAITNSPGNHQQIADEIGAKMANVPSLNWASTGMIATPNN
jgi:hypothetical protein